MYTKDLSELVYSSNIQEDFIFKLNIHYLIFSRSIKTGTAYLYKYVFTDKPVEGAKDLNLSIGDVYIMLEKDRLEGKVGRKVILIPVLDDDHTKTKEDTVEFNSISDCLVFLKTIVPSNKTTLCRYIESGKPSHGFICEWGSAETNSLMSKSIGVSVTDTLTGETFTYLTIRKAALSFAPDIKTTGQTIKAYIENGKLFKERYLIKYLS